MLTMIHSNHARIENGQLLVDRKFHDGMSKYASLMEMPIVTVNPKTRAGDSTMDLISVPIDKLSYEIVTLETDSKGRLLPQDAMRLNELIRRTKLIYGGGFGSSKIARKMGVPYISVLEYDLQTQQRMICANLSNPVRKSVRTARQAFRHFFYDIPTIRHAHSVHCNGYPVFDEIGRYTSKRLLYLDSRMSREYVIGEDELESRLFKRSASVPLRLLFSGRYEKVKGALDAVLVGVECLRRGLNIEMHTFGQGSQLDEMRHAAESAPGKEVRIHVHEAIPYPELVARSKSFDVFVCCHTQHDPSCTYLESMGAGLPIVGYGNRMWKRLSEVSQVGYWSEIGSPDRVVDSIAKFVTDNQLLPVMSRRARAFALAHCYEIEFQRRTDALLEALGKVERSSMSI